MTAWAGAGQPPADLPLRMPLIGERSPVQRSSSISDQVELSGLEPLTSHRLVLAAARCHAGVMRYSDGGGLTAAEWASREQVRLAAADQATLTGHSWWCGGGPSKEPVLGSVPSRRAPRRVARPSFDADSINLRAAEGGGRVSRWGGSVLGRLAAVLPGHCRRGHP